MLFRSSACPSARKNGDCGHHKADDLPPDLYQALLDYDGSSPWIGPIKTKYGFHVIRPAGQIGEHRARQDEVLSEEPIQEINEQPDDSDSTLDTPKTDDI